MPVINSATLDSGGRLNPQVGTGILKVPSPTGESLFVLDADAEDVLSDHLVRMLKGEDPFAEEIAKAAIIWSSPAGKKRIAEPLVKMFPVHKTYVEAFAGSGAVFFAKEAVPVEVINDMDPDIADAWRTVKSLTRADIERLKRMDWTGDRRKFLKLRDNRPADRVERLHRFLYVRRFSQMKQGRTFSGDDQGVDSGVVARLEKLSPRVRHARIFRADYEKVVKQFDGADALHFLDPPYVGYQEVLIADRNSAAKKFDEQRFVDVVTALKGNVMVTYGARGTIPAALRKVSGWHLKSIRTKRTGTFIQNAATRSAAKWLTNLVFTNYEPPVAKSADGEFEVADVEDLDKAMQQMEDENREADAEVFSLRKSDLATDPGTKEEKHQAVFQYHFRGESLHADLRVKVGDKAVGWTFAIQRAGKLSGVDGVDAAKEVASAFSTRGSRYTKPMDAPNSVVAVPKSEHDPSWLDFEGTIEPGKDGGGEATGGIVVIVDRPTVEFGAQKPDSCEMFLSGSKVGLNGRLLIGKTDRDIWLARFSRELTPYVLTEDAVAAGDMPAQGRSGMPQSLRDATPKNLCFWEASDAAERRKVRDALVASETLSSDNVAIVDGEFRRTVTKCFLVDGAYPAKSAGPLPVRPSVVDKDTAIGFVLYQVNVPEDTDGDKARSPVTHALVVAQPLLTKVWLFMSEPLREGVRCLASDYYSYSEPRTWADLESSIRGMYTYYMGNERKEPTLVSLDRGDAEYVAVGETRFVFRLGGQSHSGFYTLERISYVWLASAGLFEPLFTAEGEMLPEHVVPEDEAEEKVLDRAMKRAFAEDMAIVYKRKDQPEEEHFVLGIVLEPNDLAAGLAPDAQGDVYSKEDVRKAAHGWMEKTGGQLGFMHKQLLNKQAVVLETYLAPVAFDLPSPDGKTRTIREGTWLLGIRVVDNGLWADIRSGALNGFSIGGYARREELKA